MELLKWIASNGWTSFIAAVFLIIALQELLSFVLGFTRSFTGNYPPLDPYEDD